MTDAALMAAIAAGDHDAFSCLYARHRGYVYAIVRGHLADPADREDVSQEVWLRVYRSARTFRADARFPPWLARIAANECRRHLKRGYGRQTVDLPDGYDRPDAAEAAQQQLEARAVRARLRGAIEALPPHQAQVLVAHTYGGQTFEQIAAEHGCTQSTTQSRHRYGVRKLRAALCPK